MTDEERAETNAAASATGRLFRWSIKQTLVLIVVVTAVGAAALLATFGHVPLPERLAALSGLMGVLFVSVPPLWFWLVFSRGAANPLAAIAWRFLGALLLLGLAGLWEGTARNCYLVVLIPCYFSALSLESWLLIRQFNLTVD